MITKEDTREMLAVIGSKDCHIFITAHSHIDGKLKQSKSFKDSDKALKWVVDETDEKDKLIITIS